MTVNFHYKSINIPNRKITSLKCRTISREDLFLFFGKKVADREGLLLKCTFAPSAKCAARSTKSSIYLDKGLTIYIFCSFIKRFMEFKKMI